MRKVGLLSDAEHLRNKDFKKTQLAERELIASKLPKARGLGKKLKYTDRVPTRVPGGLVRDNLRLAHTGTDGRGQFSGGGPAAAPPPPHTPELVSDDETTDDDFFSTAESDAETLLDREAPELVSDDETTDDDLLTPTESDLLTPTESEAESEDTPVEGGDELESVDEPEDPPVEGGDESESADEWYALPDGTFGRNAAAAPESEGALPDRAEDAVPAAEPYKAEDPGPDIYDSLPSGYGEQDRRLVFDEYSRFNLLPPHQSPAMDQTEPDHPNPNPIYVRNAFPRGWGRRFPQRDTVFSPAPALNQPRDRATEVPLPRLKGQKVTDVLRITKEPVDVPLGFVPHLERNLPLMQPRVPELPEAPGRRGGRWHNAAPELPEPAAGQRTKRPGFDDSSTPSKRQKITYFDWVPNKPELEVPSRGGKRQRITYFDWVPKNDY